MKSPSMFGFGLNTVAGIIFALPAAAVINMDMVTIGNVGNPADAATGSVYGAVAYEYRIARNETTIAQYAEFLNAVAKTDTFGLYNSNMSSQAFIAGISQSGSSGAYTYSVVAGTGNKPITYVSWFDAARFCNWMHNGQGGGGTETGAYTLNGAISGIYTVTPGARFWIPSENEWYKAAYYDPAKGGTGGYWTYATQANTMTTNSMGVAGASNFWDGDYVGYPGMALTDAGAYGVNSDSYYGTNDQTGNVSEWTDGLYSGTSRVLRGGAWGYTGVTYGLRSADRSPSDTTNEYLSFGFRVASVPEPTTLVLTFLLGGLLLSRRSR